MWKMWKIMIPVKRTTTTERLLRHRRVPLRAVGTRGAATAPGGRVVPESCTLSPGPAHGRRTVPSTKKKRMSPIIMHAAHCGRGHTAHGPSGAGVRVCAGVIRSHQRMAMLWPGRAPLSASRDVGSTLPGLQMVVLPELRAAPALCNGALRLLDFLLRPPYRP